MGDIGRHSCSHDCDFGLNQAWRPVTFEAHLQCHNPLCPAMPPFLLACTFQISACYWHGQLILDFMGSPSSSGVPLSHTSESPGHPPISHGPKGDLPLSFLRLAHILSAPIPGYSVPSAWHSSARSSHQILNTRDGGSLPKHPRSAPAYPSPFWPPSPDETLSA